MNAATPPPRRLFWRRLRLLLVFTTAALVLAVVTLLGLRTYLLRQYEARLREVVAQTDEIDPRWRWDDLLADRREVPDDQNSALHMQEAARLMPALGTWPPRRPPALRVVFDCPEREQGVVAVLAGPAALAALARYQSEARPDWGKELSALPPDEPLPAELLAELRADLAQRAEALALARRTAGLADGRYPIEWKKTPYDALVPQNHQVRAVGDLLNFDLALAVEEGDLRRAVLDCRAQFAVAHSLGDEPFLVVQLARVAVSLTAVSGLERILARGEIPNEADLDAIRVSLWREDDSFVLRQTLRGDRALGFDFLEKVAQDDLTLDDLADRKRADDSVSRLYRWAWARVEARLGQSIALERMNAAVALAGGRGPARLRGLGEWQEDIRKLGASLPRADALLVCVPKVTEAAEAFHRYEAWSQSATVALALEKFRRHKGRWPEALEQLVPVYLPRVPDDPFADAPLRYARTETGVVVYSIGVDGKDDGGRLAERRWKPGDLPFRLLDPERRRTQQEKAP